MDQGSMEKRLIGTVPIAFSFVLTNTNGPGMGLR